MASPGLDQLWLGRLVCLHAPTNGWRMQFKNRPILGAMSNLEVQIVHAGAESDDSRSRRVCALESASPPDSPRDEVRRPVHHIELKGKMAGCCSNRSPALVMTERSCTVLAHCVCLLFHSTVLKWATRKQLGYNLLVQTVEALQSTPTPKKCRIFKTLKSGKEILQRWISRPPPRVAEHRPSGCARPFN